MLKRAVACCMAGCSLLAIASTASAEPPLPYNTVELQAEAQREVQNDLFKACLFVELNDPSAATLAGRGYKLQRLNVANGYNAPQPRLAMARMALSAPDVAAPDLEAGVSLVTVTASGAIEVLE